MENSKFSLTILGSGTSIPSPGRRPASYFVRTPDASLLLDCGSGAAGSLANAGGSLQTLAGVALSHLHPDHTGDLVTLLFALVNPAHPPREQPFFIWGPPGVSALMQALRGVYGRWIEPPGCEVTVVELSPGEPLVLGSLRLTPLSAEHTEHCFSFRAETGHGSFCYSGDTGPCAGLRQAARGVDLLVCECSVMEEEEITGHMKASEVGDLARDSGCREVVLTHLYPHIEAADPVVTVKDRFDGPVRLAQDGMVLKVGPG